MGWSHKTCIGHGRCTFITDIVSGRGMAPIELGGGLKGHGKESVDIWTCGFGSAIGLVQSDLITIASETPAKALLCAPIWQHV